MNSAMVVGTSVEALADLTYLRLEEWNEDEPVGPKGELTPSLLSSSQQSQSRDYC